MAEEEIQFTPETLSAMLEMPKLLRDKDLSHQGISDADKRPYLIGLLTGICIGHGIPFPEIVSFIKDPTVQAMFAGVEAS